MVSASGLVFRLFGTFSVHAGEQPLRGLDGRKVQELLGYLLLHRGRPVLREGLMAELWGDLDDGHARKYLRQTLWQLRTALDGAGSPPALLQVEADAVLLDDRASFWLDVGQLERACAQIQGVPGATLSASAARALREAVEAYRGDLLEGWYTDWCLEERERLEVLYLGALAKLLAYSEAHGEYEHGLAYGTRILRCDRAREHAHRGLMRLYYRAGDRTAALRQYDRCVAILREELDVAPTRRTQALYEQIRADRLWEPPERPEPQPGLTGDGTGDRAAALSPARHLTAAIDDLQAQLRRLQEHVASIQQLALGQQQR